MHIGALTVEFRLHGLTSIKAKRSIAASLKRKLRNKFNVSVAEVDGLDNTEMLILAVVTVANEAKRVDSQLHKAYAMIEAATSEEIVHFSTEIFMG
ncbi:MAG: DUF503 domain-containing protein [Desulfovermiculus sp.]